MVTSQDWDKHDGSVKVEKLHANLGKQIRKSSTRRKVMRENHGKKFRNK